MPPRTSLSYCLSGLSDFLPEDLPSLTPDLSTELILQALWATGTASIRRRRLPAEQVVWLVLGMALFRHLSIVQIVDQLGLALPKGRATIVPAAIHQARARLGALPMRWLFEATAQRWAHHSARQDDFWGLALYGIDGTTLRVPDSEENRTHFGGPDTHRGPSGYPLLRLVTLMAVRSHLIAAAALGPYSPHELSYAESLWDQVPERSLVVLDRGFFSAWVFYRLLTGAAQRHFLIRLRTDFKARLLKRLGPGDQLVELRVSRQPHDDHPALRPIRTGGRVNPAVSGPSGPVGPEGPMPRCTPMATLLVRTRFGRKPVELLPGQELTIRGIHSEDPRWLGLPLQLEDEPEQKTLWVRAEENWLSRRHVTISLSPHGEILVKDLNSTNGTWLLLPGGRAHVLDEGGAVHLALKTKDELSVTRADARGLPPPKELGIAANAEELVTRVSGALDKESAQGAASRDAAVCLKLLDDQGSCGGAFLLPLDRKELVLSWGGGTPDIAIILWLQEVVREYNILRYKDSAPGWRFTAASAQRREALKLAQLVSPTLAPVLILGPTGTGKTFLAREIHAHSARRGRPFVHVNCAAIAAHLLESELFGHEAGAFTSASRRKGGLVEEAHEGTLFLDEIGELRPEHQAKLLLFLESHRFRRVGGTKDLQVSVRIIAATNRPLNQMVENGQFRRDLYNRLAVFPIDVSLGAEDYLALIPGLLADAYEELGGSQREADDHDAVDALRPLVAAQTWDGGARALRNRLLCCLIHQSDAGGSLCEAWALGQSRRVAMPERRPEHEYGKQEQERITSAVRAIHFTRVLMQALADGENGWVERAADLYGCTPQNIRQNLKSWLGINSVREATPERLVIGLDAQREALQPYLPQLGLRRDF